MKKNIAATLLSLGAKDPAELLSAEDFNRIVSELSNDILSACQQSVYPLQGLVPPLLEKVLRNEVVGSLTDAMNQAGHYINLAPELQLWVDELSALDWPCHPSLKQMVVSILHSVIARIESDHDYGVMSRQVQLMKLIAPLLHISASTHHWVHKVSGQEEDYAFNATYTCELTGALRSITDYPYGLDPIIFAELSLPHVEQSELRITEFGSIGELRIMNSSGLREAVVSALMAQNADKGGDLLIAGTNDGRSDNTRYDGGLSLTSSILLSFALVCVTPLLTTALAPLSINNKIGAIINSRLSDSNASCVEKDLLICGNSNSQLPYLLRFGGSAPGKIGAILSGLSLILETLRNKDSLGTDKSRITLISSEQERLSGRLQVRSLIAHISYNMPELPNNFIFQVGTWMGL